ncbi:transferase family-domain-containing protein [Xylaria cubensis]|nr:transferase family-domain-containing protein [Xylaria cubensis]
MGHPTAASLSPMDYIMPRFYANCIFTLRLKNGVPFEKVHDVLQQSLRKTCDELPVIGHWVYPASNSREGVPGMIETRNPGNSRLEVVCNDLSTKLPSYEEFVLEGLKQEDLDAETLLPRGATHWSLGESGLPILLTQANFLEGGLLLGIGIFHSVIDGASFMLMMKVWASYAHSMQEGHNAPNLGPQLNLHPDSCNYEIPEKLWSAAGGQKVSTADVGALPADVWRAAGLHHPRVTNNEISNNDEDVEMRTAILYIPGASLDALRSDASGPAAGAHGTTLTPITANDALMALMWRCQMRARATAASAVKDPAYNQDQQTLLDTTFNGRRLFSDDLPWSYMGSMVFLCTAAMTVGGLISPTTSLADIARAVRDSMESLSQKRLHGAFSLASALPDYVPGKSLRYPYATFQGTEVMITSMLAISAYEMSFGSALFGNAGRPDYVRPPRREFDAICRRCIVLPMQVSRGCEVMIEMKAEEMELLLADDELRKYCKVVD